jgi:sulfate transport system ATP-binding protein
MDIEISNLSKRFGDFVALDDVSLTVHRGELVALLGPSGSGKTTLLRIVAGLERASSGSILFGGEDADACSLRERRVGFVFQHYALFRHMTVFDNVAYGLRVKPRRQRPAEAVIRERVTRLLTLVQLDPFLSRYPSQLSGGQRQRVALARALAIEPSVLLLDEPFGALDAKVRKELRRWLRDLHDEMQLTSVFVTHDQEEALELADRVVLMNLGRVEQIGPPDFVYEHPASAFAYEFLGNVNRFECRLVDGKAVFPGGEIVVPEERFRNVERAVAYVRPHDVQIFAGVVMAGLAVRVCYISAAGPLAKVEVVAGDGGQIIEIEISRSQLHALALKVGQTVSIRASKARVFSLEGDRPPSAIDVKVGYPEGIGSEGERAATSAAARS